MALYIYNGLAELWQGGCTFDVIDSLFQQGPNFRLTRVALIQMLLCWPRTRAGTYQQCRET